MSSLKATHGHRPALSETTKNGITFTSSEKIVRASEPRGCPLPSSPYHPAPRPPEPPTAPFSLQGPAATPERACASPSARPVLRRRHRPGVDHRAAGPAQSQGLTGRSSEFPLTTGRHRSPTPASHAPPRPQTIHRLSRRRSHHPALPGQRLPRSLSLGSCAGFRFKPPAGAASPARRPGCPPGHAGSAAGEAGLPQPGCGVASGRVGGQSRVCESWGCGGSASYLREGSCARPDRTVAGAGGGPCSGRGGNVGFWGLGFGVCFVGLLGAAQLGARTEGQVPPLRSLSGWEEGEAPPERLLAACLTRTGICPPVLSSVAARFLCSHVK